MEAVEIHFFHGFLGEAEDWNACVEALSYPSVKHDLHQDFEKLSGDTNYFQQWASLKEKELSRSPVKKIVVGYSMGGRLLLHLNPEVYEKMILVASHPGLEEGVEEREESDAKWIARFHKDLWSQWLSKWNKQEVFQYDRQRPARSLRQNIPQVLKYWSLAKQEKRDQYFKDHGDKIYWTCGALDKKFVRLSERIHRLVPGSHISVIENSGHGVLFDQPQLLAKKITEIVDNVC